MQIRAKIAVGVRTITGHSPSMVQIQGLDKHAFHDKGSPVACDRGFVFFDEKVTSRINNRLGFDDPLNFHQQL